MAVGAMSERSGAAATVSAPVRSAPDVHAFSQAFDVIAQSPASILVAGQLRFVLARGIGEAFVTADVPPQKVLEVLQDALAEKRS